MNGGRGDYWVLESREHFFDGRTHWIGRFQHVKF